MTSLKNEPAKLAKCGELEKSIHQGSEELEQCFKTLPDQQAKVYFDVQCRFLQQYMMKNYGIGTIDDIQTKYTKLTDWVDVNSTVQQESVKIIKPIPIKKVYGGAQVFKPFGTNGFRPLRLPDKM